MEANLAVIPTTLVHVVEVSICIVHLFSIMDANLAKLPTKFRTVETQGSHVGSSEHWH
jgi:hypothetical protein